MSWIHVLIAKEQFIFLLCLRSYFEHLLSFQFVPFVVVVMFLNYAKLTLKIHALSLSHTLTHTLLHTSTFKCSTATSISLSAFSFAVAVASSLLLLFVSFMWQVQLLLTLLLVLNNIVFINKSVCWSSIVYARAFEFQHKNALCVLDHLFLFRSIALIQ